MNKNIIPFKSIPVDFEEKELRVVDNRFSIAKIWIAHTGENRNNCIFTKEVLESMIPSLANIPILGYIQVTDEGELDFEAHEEVLEIQDGTLKFRYLGHAYGVIPENNNAHFEMRYGEDGVEREYLVVEGLLWKKFTEVEEIFENNGGFKSHSLELEPSSIQGRFNEFGMFVYSSAKFEGACMLGEGITPAMISSTIERFSTNNIKLELSEMLKEFNTYFSTVNKEGDDNVKEPEELVVVEPEVIKDFTKEEPIVEPEVVEPIVEPIIEPIIEEPTEPIIEPDKFTRTFELSHDDIRNSLYNKIDNSQLFDGSWYWIAETFDNYAIVHDEDNDKYFKLNYVKNENSVELGESEEIFSMWVSSNEKTALELSRVNFEALKQEVEGLRKFKSKTESSQKKLKLKEYANILDKENYKAIESNLSKFTMDEVEKEIAYKLLKNNYFSVKNEPDVRIPAYNTSKDDSPYGSLSVYFHK